MSYRCGISLLAAVLAAPAPAAPGAHGNGHYPAAILEMVEQIRAEVDRDGLGFQVGANAALQYPIEALCGRKAGLVPAEFAEHEPGRLHNRPPQPPAPPLPSTWLGWSSTVKDQANCGSCWAFGTIGALEGIYLKSVAGAPAISMNDDGTFNVSGASPDLSEQQLVSCNALGWGCNGGNVAFQMLMPTESGTGYYHGAVTETCFPYKAQDALCTLCSPTTYTPVLTWGYLTSDTTIPTVAAIKEAITTHGCVTAYVNVDRTFQAYQSGVFTSRKKYRSTNHQVVLCGWDDGKQAWLLKNSWGPSWGIGGFMWIAYTASRVGEGAAWCTTGNPIN